MAYPDAVALLIGYLGTKTSEEVGSRVPNPRPDKHVQVRRVGGPKRPPVTDVPRVDIICRALTEPDAMALLGTMRTAVGELYGTSVGGVQVYRVEEAMGPRQDDDPLTHTPMAWMTFSITLRADDAIR